MYNGQVNGIRYILQICYYLLILSFLHSEEIENEKNELSNERTYKGCFGQITIWLHNEGGYCNDPAQCVQLQQCTVLYGNLIFRGTVNPIDYDQALIKPMFSNLTEITGFLVIAFYNYELFDLLPGLSVLRGNDLVGNYALIVYVDEVKGIYFPSLTTILHGGVRIDRNNRLCYADGVRWKSIVRDVFQTEKFGIVIKSNNQNCDKSCVKGQCFAGAGHGNNPKAQYCWGPGINETDNQCQRFCDVQCGLKGCVDNTKSICCHTQCLGGCDTEDSTLSCHACLNYRMHSTGECVLKCPNNFVLIDNLYCSQNCSKADDLILNGKCVSDCPAGYVKTLSKTCVKCSNENSCQKVCNLLERIDDKYFKGAVLRVPSDVKSKGLIGCTTLNGSLWIQLAEGTGSQDEFMKELRSIKEITGHIRIQQSSLKSLDFLENLEIIDPPKDQLLHGSYAVSVYENGHLATLWKPRKTLQVTRGSLFFQVNPDLCPQVIYQLQDMMVDSSNRNVTGDISKLSNGHRVTCEIEELELKISEVNLDTHQHLLFTTKFPTLCITKKCVLVEWNFTRVQSSYNIIFFKIYYRKLETNETADKQVIGDYINDKQWKSADFEKPVVAFDSKMIDSLVTTITEYIKELSPAAKYAFYLKEIVANTDEGKTSKIHYLTISRGIPEAPLGFEASFLSQSSIKLQWQPPDFPNGKIVSYQIYWRKSSYSFWQDQRNLDWCKRDVKAGLTTVYVPTKTEIEVDTCARNRSCSCETETTEVIEAVREDREAHSFLRNFEDRIIQVIFTKKTNKGKKKKKKKLPDMNKKTVQQNDSSTLQTTQATIQPLVSEVPTTQYLRYELENPKANVTGDVFTFVVDNLDYFQDYEFTVCACTENGNGGGCARPRKDNSPINIPCAVAQARTASDPLADNLNCTVAVQVDGPTYNLTWLPPLKPNAVILKYEIFIEYAGGNYQRTHCQPSSDTPVFSRQLRAGAYTANIRAISPAGNGSWSDAVSFVIVDDGAQTSDKSVVIGVSIAAVLLCVILIIVVLYYSLFKRYFEKDVPGVLYASVNPEYMNSSGVYLPDEWELNREKIELVRELGQGSFGMVYEGIAHDIADVPELRVAIKTVNEKATIRDRIEFLQEASIMKAFNSNHVVKLIGVVSQGQPTLVVMELMERHDLRTFLRGRRPGENSKLLPPSKDEVFQMAAEIADGMAYLAARKFVHRDLAARNCMVAIDFTVKIGDFGMARDIYETDYYRKGGKGLLPVRWMAPESLKDGVFKTASDVWSFGVVLWEISTLAAQPYQGMSNPEVLTYVINGGLPDIPHDCNSKLKDLMLMCWQRDASHRPLFLEIIRLLEDDVSEDFILSSFYHEMKKLALEDTFCDNELHLILNRDTLDRSRKNQYSSMEEIDSCKPSPIINKTNPSTPKRTESLDLVDHTELNDPNCEQGQDVVKPLQSIGGKHLGGNVATNREKSLYDNYGTVGENMKYGDTPVHDNQLEKEGETNELQLDKIFFNKPVPV